MKPTEAPKSNRGIYILVIVVVLLLAGAAVFALQNSQPNEVNQDTTQTETTTVESDDSTDEATPAPSERMTVTYTDNGFEPQDITVKKGTTVMITNNSSKDVQFSSDDHPVHRDNPEMNLKTLSPGESTSYAPSEAGTWGFHDHLDDSKTGSVTVTE